MGTFTLTHEIDCDTDRFWQIFFDTEFSKRLFREGLEFSAWDLASEKDEGAAVVRVVHAAPKLDLPGPVVKLIGAGFSYVENGRFDKAEKVFRWTIRPSALEGKLRNEGSVRVESLGATKCKRIVDITLEAKVFGVGGLIESSVEKGVRQAWDKSAAYINEWLKTAPQ